MARWKEILGVVVAGGDGNMSAPAGAVRVLVQRSILIEDLEVSHDSVAKRNVKKSVRKDVKKNEPKEKIRNETNATVAAPLRDGVNDRQTTKTVSKERSVMAATVPGRVVGEAAQYSLDTICELLSRAKK